MPSSSNHVRLSVAVALLLTCVAGCSGSSSSSPSSIADASLDQSPTSDAPSDAPDADVPDLPMCYADFPCQPGMSLQCVDDQHFQTMVTHDCHFHCGPGPCSGGSCDPEGPVQACPTGTVCVKGVGTPAIDHCGSPDAGTDAATDAQLPGCDEGFCRDAVQSSCGDSAYYAAPLWDCTTGGGHAGYCCLPKAGCITGYCTASGSCKPPLMMTQVGCGLDSGPGSCCVEPK